MTSFTPQQLQAMSQEQLSALFAKLQDDKGFQEKFKDAAGLDTAVAIAKDAGFDVSKVDWLKYQAKQTLELSDEELEGVAGGSPNFVRRGDAAVDFGGDGSFPVWGVYLSPNFTPFSKQNDY
jgi:predicted ribosomally synthesized peptide with nif11-like leader